METVLTRITRNGQVTLPMAARRALNLGVGDYVEVRLAGDEIVLTPKKIIDKSQSYFWTPEWQGAEQEASDDIAAGRVRGFDDVDDLIASLHKGRQAKE